MAAGSWAVLDEEDSSVCRLCPAPACPGVRGSLHPCQAVTLQRVNLMFGGYLGRSSRGTKGGGWSCAIAITLHRKEQPEAQQALAGAERAPCPLLRSISLQPKRTT